MSGPLIDQYLEELQDDIQEGKSKKTSFVKVTRQTKIDRAIGSLSTQLAKAGGDPWYKKMIKHREKYFKFRKMIKTKYKPKVRARAVSGTGIKDLLQKIKQGKNQK